MNAWSLPAVPCTHLQTPPITENVRTEMMKARMRIPILSGGMKISITFTVLANWATRCDPKMITSSHHVVTDATSAGARLLFASRIADRTYGIISAEGTIAPIGFFPLIILTTWVSVERISESKTRSDIAARISSRTPWWMLFPSTRT